jgi:hypothetical protein
MDKKQEIKGLGDVVHKVAKITQMDKVAKFVAKTAGKSDCGCKKRQDTLNKRFPFKKEI